MLAGRRARLRAGIGGTCVRLSARNNDSAQKKTAQAGGKSGEVGEFTTYNLCMDRYRVTQQEEV